MKMLGAKYMVSFQLRKGIILKKEVSEDYLIQIRGISTFLQLCFQNLLKLRIHSFMSLVMPSIMILIRDILKNKLKSDYNCYNYIYLTLGANGGGWESLISKRGRFLGVSPRKTYSLVNLGFPMQLLPYY